MLIHQYIYHIAILQLILIVSILYLYRTIYSYANKKAEKDNETKLQVTINELEIYKKNLITKRSHKIKEAVENKLIIKVINIFLIILSFYFIVTTVVPGKVYPTT